MTAIGILLGVGLAAGVLIVVDGIVGTGSVALVPKRPRFAADYRRLGSALGSGLLAVLLTRWPVAGPAAGALAWFAPQLFGGKASRQADTDRTEAIASWTEMLRDTITAAHGIEAAITTTAGVAPLPIRDEITQLARRVQHEPLENALAEFADDLAHPIADLIVAALSSAATHSARDLGELLSTLSAAARDEASMRIRIDASRARMRTAVRVVTGVTVSMAAVLVLFNPSYVAVYRTPTGQMVLVFIFGCWGAALWWLAQMSRFDEPERFFAASAAPGTVR